MTSRPTSAGSVSSCTRRSAQGPAGVSTKVSVVICAYTEQRWSLLEAAVDSAVEQRPAPTEVIVVVDHNPSLYERVVERFDLAPLVQVHHNTFGRGLAGARNTGVAAAGSPVVAFLDDDAWAEPEWLARHARHYDDPAVVGVGGMVRPSWAHASPSWFPEEFAWVVGCTHSGIDLRVQQIRNPVGANMSFRRERVDDVGGFREGLGRIGSVPLGCEETELAIRMTSGDAQARIVFDPAAAVRHHVPAQRATWTYFRRRCWSEGLSKARVSQLAGAGAGLSEERGYVTRTLPRGVARSLHEAATRRDHRQIARAGAIVSGLAITTGGYVTGRVRAGAAGDREVVAPLLPPRRERS